MLPAGCPPDPGNGALANGYDLLRGHCVGVAVSEKSVSYDVHTLAKAIATTEQITRVSVTAAFVDKGYRGNDDKGSATIHISGSSSRRLTRTQKKRRKRRSAVEKIGHLKTDNRMGRCFLKGLIGDSINAVLGCRRIKPTEAAARHCARAAFLALESCYRAPNGSVRPVLPQSDSVLTLVRDYVVSHKLRLRIAPGFFSADEITASVSCGTFAAMQRVLSVFTEFQFKSLRYRCTFVSARMVYKTNAERF